MAIDIRPATEDDHEPVLALMLRAWEPVFPSINAVIGPELAHRLHGEDWREYQSRDVREALESPSMNVWVSEADGALTGFVAARVVDPHRLIGEVYIVGVDPSAQRRGIGAALVEHAVQWMRDQGLRVAFIGTGGDPGHAPARALYDALGYRPSTTVQYYKAL